MTTPDPRERLIEEFVAVRLVARDATAELARARPLLERLEGYLKAEAEDRRTRRTWADVAQDVVRNPLIVTSATTAAILVFQYLTGYTPAVPPALPEPPDVVLPAPAGVPREP
jgi:hypothetical protein